MTYKQHEAANKTIEFAFDTLMAGDIEGAKVACQEVQDAITAAGEAPRAVVHGLEGVLANIRTAERRLAKAARKN